MTRILKTTAAEPIGIYFLASEKYLLAPYYFPDKYIRVLEDALGLSASREIVYESGLIGLFCAGNSNGFVVPRASDSRSLAHVLKVNVEAIDDRHTALGNLILANDKGAIISPSFGRRAEAKIMDALNVEAVRGTVAGLETVGSCGIATNSGVLLHPEASDSEMELVESVLKVKVGIGTLDRGSPFVGSVAVGNGNGIVVGKDTTPVEITRLEDILSS